MSDPIERQEAIDAVCNCTDVFITNLPTMVYKADVYKALAEVLSAEPKKGKWITTRTWEHDGEIYCDQCGSEAPTKGDYRQIKTNFCPDCGSDNREE